MIIASVSQFHIYLKAVVAAFNQEKALVGAFSVISNLRRPWRGLAVAGRWRHGATAAATSAACSRPLVRENTWPRLI